MKKNYNYAAGGQIFSIPNTEHNIMFYHSERHREQDSTRFYSTIGLAMNYGGVSDFSDIGEIIQSHKTYKDQNSPDVVELMGGAFAVYDGYVYVFFKDYIGSGYEDQINLAVARATIKDLINFANKGEAAKFNKYYKGLFSEDGIGGKASPLELSNQYVGWISVSYNTYIDAFIMVGVNYFGKDANLFIMSSIDGIEWQKRHQIETEEGESFYPSIIGVEGNPLQTGSQFYVYYTLSKQTDGWSRWSDAQLVRRLVTIML